MNAPQVFQPDKALPSLTRNKLPLPPPQDDPAFSSFPTPRPPPKTSPDHDTLPRANGQLPPPIDVSASDELLGQGGALTLSCPPRHLILLVSFRPQPTIRHYPQPIQPRFTR